MPKNLIMVGFVVYLLDYPNHTVQQDQTVFKIHPVGAAPSPCDFKAAVTAAPGKCSFENT